MTENFVIIPAYYALVCKDFKMHDLNIYSLNLYIVYKINLISVLPKSNQYENIWREEISKWLILGS